MKSQFTRLRGMPDLIPATIAPWQRLETAVAHAMRAYGYGEMRTPLIERTSLFQRSIGEATDIVEKEMYSFTDRKGESLSLRPENTAGCVRAAIENGMLQPGSVNRTGVVPRTYVSLRAPAAWSSETVFSGGCRGVRFGRA